MFYLLLCGNGGGEIPIVQTEENPMRSIFAPATPRSDSMVRPNCSQCGTATVLIGIEPDGPGRELHTFQCPKCEHFELRSGKPHRQFDAQSS